MLITYIITTLLCYTFLLFEFKKEYSELTYKTYKSVGKVIGESVILAIILAIPVLNFIITIGFLFSDQYGFTDKEVFWEKTPEDKKQELQAKLKKIQES